MKIQTIGELRKFIADLPDEMVFEPKIAIFVRTMHKHEYKGRVYYRWCYTKGYNDGVIYNCCKQVGADDNNVFEQVAHIEPR